MIWLIALVPAVVVILVAIWTESKGATLLAALIAALLGLLTGSPAYAVLDLGAVAIATLFAWKTVSFQTRDPAKKAAKAAELALLTKKIDAFGDAVFTAYYWIVAILCAAGLMWIFFLQPKAPVSPASKPALAPPLPQVIAPSVPVVAAPTPNPQGQIQKKKVSSKTPMQRCVEIKDEAKMLSCLEGLP